jgi:uncharacterized membrane protein
MKPEKAVKKDSVLGAFKRQFFAGLVVIIPLSLTVYFIRLFFLLISQTLFPLFTKQHWVVFPPTAIRPLSFVLTLSLIWFVGVVASNFIGKRLVSWIEALVRLIPFFRGLYEAIQKVTEAFFGARSLYQSVVLVEYPRKGVYTFGFVTSHIAGKVFHSNTPHLCIFIPTVPNPTSGVLLYVPESETIPVNLSIEEVIKILVSHGFVPIGEGAIEPRRPD